MPPRPRNGEYSQAFFVHNMIKGYARRVHNPADADLFYVPIYNDFLKCHPRPNDVHKDVASLLGKWIARFPSKHGGPIFFTTSGQVCSCLEPKYNRECNPVSANRSLYGNVVTLAWESPVPGLSTSLPNVVVPYISQFHDILPWRVKARREWFVMMAAGIRTHKCSYCGVCGRSRPRTPWFFDKDLPCACGCNNRRRELWKLFTGTKIPDILPLHTGLLGNGSFQNRNLHKLKATFCIEPHGDTLTRKSFYESIMLGCIPVVFREDALYLGQLPYSHTIPYRKLWVAIPRGTPFGPEIFAYLRAIKPSEIIRRRRLIKRYGRRLVFSSNSSQHGGYNDFGNPDAFASALKEVWDRSKQKMHMPLATPAKYKCRGPPCDPQCKLQNKGIVRV